MERALLCQLHAHTDSLVSLMEQGRLVLTQAEIGPTVEPVVEPTVQPTVPELSSGLIGVLRAFYLAGADLDTIGRAYQVWLSGGRPF